jgi:hypothetical protein
MILGGVAGGIAGYMFFTDQGRRWRRQLEPALEDLAVELSHFRGTVGKAAGVASEGWKLLNEAFGEQSHSNRYPNPHQSSPF